MTASTEQERASLSAFIEMAEREGFDTVHQWYDAKGWVFFSPSTADCWRYWQAARRAPVVPQFSQVAQRKLDYLLEAGEAITGYAIQNKDGRRGAIDCHGFVYWWQDAAAPKPPEAECSKCGQRDFGQTGEYPCQACGLPTVHDENVPPVQLPEPCCRVSVDEDGASDAGLSYLDGASQHEYGHWIDDEIQAFANAILERAAVECQESELYRGSVFASRIRALKSSIDA